MGVADMIVTIGADTSSVSSAVAQMQSNLGTAVSAAQNASSQMSGLTWLDGNQMVTNVDVAQANLTIIENKVTEAKAVLQELQDSAALGVELPGADVAAANLTLLQAKAQEARASLTDLQTQEDSAGGSATNLGGIMSEASGGFLNFTSQVGMTLMGLQMLAQGAVSLASSLLQPAATAETTQLSFTTLLHSSTAAQAAMKDLNTYASGTPMQTQWVDNAAAKILAFGGKIGDVKPEINAIGDSLSGLGKLSEASLGSIVDVFGKISAQGKITGGDMMQLSTWGIPAWQALSQSMGLPIPELQKMVTQGAIPANIALKALEQGMEGTFGGGMQKQAQAFTGLISTMQSNWQIAMAALSGPALKLLEPQLTKLGETLGSPAFQQFATSVGTKIAGAFVSMGNAAAGTVKFFQQNATALESLKVTGLVVAGIMVAGFTAWAIAAGSAAVATIAATWPILAIGAGIGLLVAGFMALYNNVAPFRDFMNQLGAGFQNVWSIISSNFMPVMQQLGGFLASVFVPVWQQMVQVWQNQMIPAWNNLRSSIAPIMPQLQAFGQFLGTVVGIALLVVTGLIGGLIGYLGGLMTGIGYVIGGISTFITGVIQYLSGIIAFFVDLFTGKWDKLGGDLATIWGGIVKMFQGAWQTIEGVFVGAINGLIGLVNGFVAGVLGPINAVLTASGQAALSVGKIPMLSIQVGGGLAAMPTYQSGIQKSASPITAAIPSSQAPVAPVAHPAMSAISQVAPSLPQVPVSQTGTLASGSMTPTQFQTALSQAGASSSANNKTLSVAQQQAADVRTQKLADQQAKAITSSGSSQVQALVAASQQAKASGNMAQAQYLAGKAATLANQQNAAQQRTAHLAVTQSHHAQVLAAHAQKVAASAAKHQQVLAASAAKHQQVLAAHAQRQAQAQQHHTQVLAASAAKHQQVLAAHAQRQAQAQQHHTQQVAAITGVQQAIMQPSQVGTSPTPIYTSTPPPTTDTTTANTTSASNVPTFTLILEFDGRQFINEVVMPTVDKIVRLKLGATGRIA